MQQDPDFSAKMVNVVTIVHCEYKVWLCKHLFDGLLLYGFVSNPKLFDDENCVTRNTPFTGKSINLVPWVGTIPKSEQHSPFKMAVCSKGLEQKKQRQNRQNLLTTYITVP